LSDVHKNSEPPAQNRLADADAYAYPHTRSDAHADAKTDAYAYAATDADANPRHTDTSTHRLTASLNCSSYNWRQPMVDLRGKGARWCGKGDG
jgi:hypothetical protein